MKRIILLIGILAILVISGCTNSSFDDCMTFCVSQEEPNKGIVLRDGGFYECPNGFCTVRYTNEDTINECFDACKNTE